MKRIPLFHNKNAKQRLFAFVDNEDFDRLNQWRWSASKDGTSFYAKRMIKRKGQKIIRIKMHRLIMNTPEHLVVDHINGNGLDNRKINLRNVTKSENDRNRVRLNSNNTSGFRHIHRHRSGKYWIIQIKENKQTTYLGSAKTIEKARKVLSIYKKKAANKGRLHESTF